MKTSGIRKYAAWLLVIPFAAYVTARATASGDFVYFLEASRLFLAGKSPYNVWLFANETQAALFYNSPLWAFLLMPFTFMPAWVTNISWLVLNAFFLYRIWKMLMDYLADLGLTTRQILVLFLLTSLFAFRFILYNFDMLQLTILMLWGSLESLAMFRKKRFLTGGCILALIINIKILPVVLIPYLLYRREWRATVSTVLFSVAFLLLPAVWTGWTFNLQLLGEWWAFINPLQPGHQSETDLGLHSLTALIPGLLSETPGTLPVRRTILSLEPATAVMITHVIRGMLILLTLAFLRWPPFRKEGERLMQLRELGYLFLLIPLIFPHQQKYAFLMILPAAFYLSFFLISFRKNQQIRNRYTVVVIFVMIAFVLMVLTTDGLIGRRLNDLTQHFKLITWGALLLIPALLCSKPAVSS